MEFDFSTFHTIVMRFGLIFIAAALTGDLVRSFCLFFFGFLNFFILFCNLQSSRFVTSSIIHFSHMTFLLIQVIHQCVIATVSPRSHKTAAAAQRRSSLLTPRDDYTGVNCDNPCRAPYCDWSRVTQDDLQTTILKIDPSKSYCLNTSDASSKSWNHQWWHAQSCGPGRATIGMRTTVSNANIFLLLFRCPSSFFFFFQKGIAFFFPH